MADGSFFLLQTPPITFHHQEEASYWSDSCQSAAEKSAFSPCEDEILCGSGQTDLIHVMTSSCLNETSLEPLPAAEMKAIASTVRRPTGNVSD